MSQRYAGHLRPGCEDLVTTLRVVPRLGVVARYLDVHPDNPQPRLIKQVADAVRDEDALIA